MNNSVATSRDEARQLNYRFYQGLPCKRGHDGVRHVSDRGCVACRRTQSKQWSADNYDRHRELIAKWAADNPERSAEHSSAWRANHPERAKEVARTWQQKNPHKVRAGSAKYRADKLRATPPWADLEAIAKVYAECPEGYQVDHIEPLCGVDRCGLHIAINLQYLTPKENQSKNNRT